METMAIYAAWITGIVTAAVIIFRLTRMAMRAAVNTYKKGNAAFDVLVGREEIRHPDTGDVIVPATEGLNVRLAGVDSEMKEMRVAITSLAKVHQTVRVLTGRVDRLADDLSDHITESRRDKELRLEEQTEMWKALRAVANTQPVDSDRD